MAVSASDLIAFAAANMPTDDSSTVGGAIDLNTRVVFTDLAADDDIEVISDNAGDTQSCNVVGRYSNGVSNFEALALTGTTAKIFAGLGVIASVQSVTLASDAIGTVTVRRSVAGATIATIPAGEQGFLRLFREASSNAAETNWYEKIFFKNTSGVSALLAALVRENSGGAGGSLKFALEDAVDDSGTSANRVTKPTASEIGASGFTGDLSTDLTLAVETDAALADLGDGVAIGVWLELNLAANASPIEDVYNLELRGNTT